MIQNLFNAQTMQVLTKVLDTAALRQEVIAHNLANLNTPGYKKSSVTFEESLCEALGADSKLALVTTHPRHLAGFSAIKEVSPETITDFGPGLRPDGNNVDLVEGLVNQTMNSFNYQATAQLLSGKITGLRTVIEGRR